MFTLSSNVTNNGIDSLIYRLLIFKIVLSYDKCTVGATTHWMPSLIMLMKHHGRHDKEGRGGGEVRELLLAELTGWLMPKVKELPLAELTGWLSWALLLTN